MKNIFQDHKGKFSSLRLYCFISLLMAMGITIWDLINKENHFLLITTYLIGAFAPKNIQKVTELSNDIKNNSNTTTI